MAIGLWGPEPLLDQEGNPNPRVSMVVYDPDGESLATVYASFDGGAMQNPLPTGRPVGQSGTDLVGNGLFYAEEGTYILVVRQGSVEVYRSVVSIGGGGGGSVDSIAEGANITVDDTDPANPSVGVKTNPTFTSADGTTTVLVRDYANEGFAVSSVGPQNDEAVIQIAADGGVSLQYDSQGGQDVSASLLIRPDEPEIQLFADDDDGNNHAQLFVNPNQAAFRVTDNGGDVTEVEVSSSATSFTHTDGTGPGQGEFSVGSAGGVEMSGTNGANETARLEFHGNDGAFETVVAASGGDGAKLLMDPDHVQVQTWDSNFDDVAQIDVAGGVVDVQAANGATEFTMDDTGTHLGVVGVVTAPDPAANDQVDTQGARLAYILELLGGGTTGQVLKKVSNADLDFHWVDP